MITMKEIIDLMRLDFICMKRKTLLPLVLALICAAATGIFMHPVFMMMILVFSWLPIEALFSITAKGNMDKLYGMLPVRRGRLVWARFLLSAIIIALATAFVIAVAWLAFKLNLFYDKELILESEGMGTFEGSVMMASVIFDLSCLFCAWELTTIFVLGMEREFIGIVTGLLLMFVATVVFVEMNIDMQSMLTKFATGMGKLYMKSVYYVVVFGVGLAIMAAFAAISYFATRRREI